MIRLKQFNIQTNISGLHRYLLIAGAISAVLFFIYLLYYLVPLANNHSFWQKNLNEGAVSSGKAATHLKNAIAFPSSATGISDQSCKLSLSESDDWFCESDDDWKRRKQVHHTQNKLNRHSNSRSLFFQNNWEPTFHCAFEQRIGNVGDGGKWVCDIYKLKTNTSSPLIYSFGSSGDFSFEQAIRRVLPNAEIHTFDRGFYRCPPGVCTFHQATIGDGRTNGEKSLSMIIDELGHRQRQIDILKIDIEGSEYAAWREFFKNSQSKMIRMGNKQRESKMPYIRQILIEIHMQHDRVQEPIDRVHELFESFRSNNYAIFHKEVNLYDPANVFEYAFIRLNHLFFAVSS